VPRAELACGRVGDDGDVMAAQPVRQALRLLSRRAACMAAGCCTFMTWGIVPRARRWWCSRRGLSSRVWAHAPVRAGLVVRGEDLSCKAKTCRGDPSSGELVGDAANWPKTGRLASVGLRPGPLLLLVLNLCLCRSWSSHCQWCWIVLCLREIISPSKGP
jgi:hypothetical protein